MLAPFLAAVLGRAVARIGLELARKVYGADPVVVLLFAILHDAMRESDGPDPQHGERGAELAARFRRRYFRTTDSQQEALEAACRDHNLPYARLAFGPTMGVCWDADRLDLWRVGRTPDEQYLSTAAARAPGMDDWAREVRDGLEDWDALAAGFEQLARRV